MGPLRLIFQYPPVFLKVCVYIYYLLNTSNAVYKDTPHIFVAAQRSAIQWAHKQNNKQSNGMQQTVFLEGFSDSRCNMSVPKYRSLFFSRTKHLDSE